MLLCYGRCFHRVPLLFRKFYDKLNGSIKATPHKARLKALYWICLHIFRHLAQKFLDIRQYACGISIQSDEKSVGASPAQALCGIALNNYLYVFAISGKHVADETMSAQNNLT